MATQVVMPKLSPTMEEGQLARWLKKEGDKVGVGEPLAEIDTDKATMEAQALADGVLRKIIVGEGETVPLGAVIAIIGTPDEDISDLVASVANAGQPARAEVTKDEAAAEPEVPVATAPQKAAASPLPALPEDSATPGGNGQPRPSESGRLIVSPIAARMAAEQGVNLKSLTGSGPGGRIVKRDIEAAITAGEGSSEQSTSVAQPQLRAVERKPAPTFAPSPTEGASPFRDEPISVMRSTIARRLVTSIGPVPHFFLTTEIEMDRIAELRRSLNDLDPSLKISVNDFVIKSAAVALVENPAINVSFQEKSVRYYERADIGVAVAIEDGLITPILRSADRKSLGQISSEVRELAERARGRKLKPEEYTGATLSISNLGMFGIDEFTAIINPPEAAILAVGAMQAKPVVRNGEVVIRQIMRVTMSCDHRVIDGATGAKFLQALKRTLENPVLLIV